MKKLKNSDDLMFERYCREVNKECSYDDRDLDYDRFTELEEYDPFEEDFYDEDFYDDYEQEEE